MRVIDGAHGDADAEPFQGRLVEQREPFQQGLFE